MPGLDTSRLMYSRVERSVRVVLCVTTRTIRRTMNIH